MPLYRRFGRVLLAPALALLGATAANAQEPDTSRKTLLAAWRVGAVNVDGRLSEEDWTRAAVASGFQQREPEPNAPATQRTEVRVLVDEGAVYIGARLFDNQPWAIAAQLGRRDADDLYSDAFHVAIDSYFDRRTAFRFSITPAGVQGDGIHFNDSDEDENWDAVYESATTIDSLGWTAELRIPLSQLRYGPVANGGTRRWGIQFVREIARAGEMSFWTPTPPTQPGIVSRFGDLLGIDSLGVPARLEVIPYVSSQVTRLPSGEANALVEATTGSARAGADVRYGLPRGLTLTATINPDFGQVEVDPAVVNLTAFETFFSERRPFFLEGNEIFGFGRTVTYNDADPPQPFYSRRIGRAPRGSVDAADARFVDEPSQTDILGAVKVSGKTPGGWSLGFLGASTEKVRAHYMTDAGVVRSAVVEPRANYLVNRVSRDLRDGHTVLGAALTGAWRSTPPEFAGILPRSALTGGVSAEHAWNQRAWTVSGYYSRSHVSGDSAYIAALQRSNTHAYQRPDRRDVNYDPSRRELQGYFYALSVQKTGRHWFGSLTYEETAPEYDVNELGFQNRSDLRALSSALRYRETSPGRMFRNWVIRANATELHNFDGDAIDRVISLGGEAEWHNFWNTELELRLQPQTPDDRLTRGGPLTLRPATRGFEVAVSSDERRRISFDGSYEFESSSAGDWRHTIEAGIDARPSSAVQLSIGIEYEPQYDHDQFVRAIVDPLATNTFGRRYVIGDFEQHELGINTRIEWTFSPKLSLQVFAQPLVSSGRFDRYKELLAPKTFDFAVYGRDRGTVTRDRANGLIQVDPDDSGPAPTFTFDEQDFTVRALRGNAVLRWEYRPGSTIYVVWQQIREDEVAGADLSATRRPTDAFRVAARNVFLVKLSYWFGG
ncbi:MAG: DUF5916 domain-containing protein [Gemmatimonadaceae bacterium]